MRQLTHWLIRLPHCRGGAAITFGRSRWQHASDEIRAANAHALMRKRVRQKSYVVIVETDDLIRQLLERWLGEAGYMVITGAPDAPALERPIRLVIVNVSKPRHAGALIRSLQAAYAAPILVVSGRFRRGLAGSLNAARQLGARNVLPKPFTRAELLAAVRDSVEDA